MVGNTVGGMDLTLALYGSLLGAMAGLPLARVASWRASRQPVDFDLDAERDLLNWLIDKPGRLVRVVGQLRADHFSLSTHGELYAEFLLAVGALPELPTSAGEEAIVAAENAVSADLESLTRQRSPELLDMLRVRAVDHSSGLTAAQTVFELGDDRLRYPGGSPVERGGAGEAPLVRRHRSPGVRRYVVASLLGAAAGAVTPAFAAHSWPVGPAFYLALGSLAVLSVGSIIWALVDQDTLLIDLETFFPLAALAWVLTVAACFAGGEPQRALRGLGLSVALAVFFRMVNALYGLYKLRTTGTRMDGMGAGDSWLVLATAGVPAALTGSLNVWYLCAISGMLVAVLVWLLRWPTPWRIERTTPFAFGPYLALGWVIGGAVAAAGLQLW